MVFRYSAIRCASAVPMSSVELQQAREVQQAPTPEPENKKAGMNGDTSPVLKSSAKPPKGIMGMFANKSVPKSQDNSKEMKPEKKEDAHDVRLCPCAAVSCSPGYLSFCSICF